MSVQGFAVVVGAGSGLGRETAFTFAERGAAGILLADLNPTSAEDVAKKSKAIAIHPHYKAIAMQVDVTKESSVAAMVEQAVAAFGRIDYFVNSAGIENKTRAPVTEVDFDDYDHLYQVNSRGTTICIKYAAERMKQQDESFATGRHGKRSLGRGSIVTLVSLAANVATPLSIQYASSKAAAMAVTKTAAIELAPYGIRVNAVCPSWAETPLLERLQTLSGPSGHDARLKVLPAGRFAKPEEIAGAIHFLSGPDASYINGVGMVIDFGASVKM